MEKPKFNFNLKMLENNPKQKLDFVYLLMHSNLYELYLGLRRRFLIRFRKKYVRQSVAKRKGHCNFPKCDCCSWANCKQSLGHKKGCAIEKNKPEVCRLFPIDKKDIPPRFSKECTYYWDKQE
jgi:Fe-S-cluster containining protein|tara:strand:- start:282 stop:650 length:369 start_codon:yes stop_codon:yes gene_type:complete